MPLPADREPKPSPCEPPAGPGLRRLVPPAIVAVIAIAVIATGWYRELSLETLIRHRAAIEGFAGPDIDQAVFYPDDDQFLIERDLTVRHYEVADSDQADTPR